MCGMCVSARDYYYLQGAPMAETNGLPRRTGRPEEMLVLSSQVGNASSKPSRMGLTCLWDLANFGLHRSAQRPLGPLRRESQRFE